MPKHETITRCLWPSHHSLLMNFTRKELRRYARELGLNTGRNKGDTAWNIAESNKATMTIRLGET